LEAFFSFSECRIGLLIYFVGVLLLLPMLEVIMFILASLFLRFFAEIVVEASGYLDQLGLFFWKFLDSHGILNALG
jgi:hypothetical protein